MIKKKLNKCNFIEQYINKAKPTLSTVYGEYIIYIDCNWKNPRACPAEENDSNELNNE